MTEFKPPAHPDISFNDNNVMVYLKSSSQNTSRYVAVLNPDEARSLGLALMESGLYLKAKNKEAQQAKEQHQTTEENMNTEDRIKKIINEHLGTDLDKIHPHSRFKEDLGADSLDAIELAMGFEEEFDIEITDDQALGLSIVSEAQALIEKKLAAVPK